MLKPVASIATNMQIQSRGGRIREAFQYANAVEQK